MKRNVQYMLLIVMVIIGALVMVYRGTQKVDYHLDEQWSYGFSNSYVRTFIGNDLFNQPLPPELFRLYATVQEHERFLYEKVYYHNSQDVHPPLFYHIIHTISSLFPDQFSKWFGIGFNIACYIVGLIALFFLSDHVLKSKTKALFVVALWGFSLGAVNTVMFIRMYSLMALLTIGFTWGAFRFLQDRRWMDLLLIFGAVFLGGLTHYYFFIFAFFLSALICLTLLLAKRWWDLVRYSVATLAGVGAVIVAFPPIIYQVTAGYRGEEAISGIKTLSINLDVIVKTFELLGTTFTAVQIPFIILGGLGLLLLGLVYRFRSRVQPMPLILAGTLFMSMYLIASIAPDMEDFQDRYFFNLFPLVALLIVAVGAWLADRFGRRMLWGLAGVMGVCLVYASLFAPSVYLFRQNHDFNRLIDDHHVIFVTPEDFRIHEFVSRYDYFTDLFVLHNGEHDGLHYVDRILNYFQIFPIEHVRLVLVVDKRFPDILGSDEALAKFTERGYRLERVEPNAKSLYDVYRIALLDG